MVTKAKPLTRKRSASARQPIGKSSKPPVYYREPGGPDRPSRHLECFRRAGIDPIERGYERSEGPCKACNLTCIRHASYQIEEENIEADRKLAGLLDKASNAAFTLVRTILTDTAGLITSKGYELERDYASLLSEYRSSMEEARRIALLEQVLPEEKGTGPRYRTAQPNGKDYELNLSQSFSADLTMSTAPKDGYRWYAELACEAGFLAAAARAFREQAQRIEKQIARWGKDADDAAIREMEYQKASTELAARSRYTYYQEVLECSDPRLVRIDSKSVLWRKRKSRSKSETPSKK